MNAAPTTIDQAIRAMDRETERCLATGDRRGYFAGMYRAVTARVRDGLEAGEFADADRMERFDVLFARRYLDACNGWHRGNPISSAWCLAFQSAELTNRLVVQHLLLGINAHINLDLGLAAADATEPGQVRALQEDFELINDVLAEMVDRMQDAIAIVSPWSRHVDRVGLRFDEALVCFSLRNARRDAWDFAVALSDAPPRARAGLVEERDEEVTRLGHRIIRPGVPLRWVVGAAQRRERHDLAEVLDLLRPTRGTPAELERRPQGQDGFDIEFRWKEEVIYWEGQRGCVFAGGWGTDPIVTHVPDADAWDRSVPSWLVGRHDEVVARLRADSRHVVREERDDSSVATGCDEVIR